MKINIYYSYRLKDDVHAPRYFTSLIWPETDITAACTAVQWLWDNGHYWLAACYDSGFQDTFRKNAWETIARHHLERAFFYTQNIHCAWTAVKNVPISPAPLSPELRQYGVEGHRSSMVGDIFAIEDEDGFAYYLCCACGFRRIGALVAGTDANPKFQAST